MKRLRIVSVTFLAAASALAQGQVEFNNRVIASIVTRVFAPSSNSPVFHQTGNGAADTPAGTQDWSGFSLIGASGTNGFFGAGTTFAQLLSANGADQPEASLQPANPTTTFRTGVASGYIAGRTATLGNVPPDSFAATLEMVAWDNSSGLYPTWAQAAPAWQAGLIAAGESGRWTQALSNPSGPPAPLFGLVSFNLYFNVPEPRGLSLASLGVLIFLLRARRRRR